MSGNLIDEAMRTEALDKLAKIIRDYSNLDEEHMRELVDHINVSTFKKGTSLIEQGELPSRCFFVLKGCARKYFIDENGKEVTADFYTEGQSINIFSNTREDRSPYSVTCLEDSVMIVGNLDEEDRELAKYPEFEKIIMKMMAAGMGEIQDTFAAFIAMSPEERVKFMMGKRPELFTRVPQHQLASYLGITPESLSRIKGRLVKGHLRIVD